MQSRQLVMCKMCSFSLTRGRTLYTLLLFVLLLLTTTVKAQELEYQMELGGALGPSFYLGDVSSAPFKHTSVMGGVVARRVFNPRMVLKGDLAVGHISGNSKGYFIPTNAESETVDGGVPTEVSFKKNLIDLGAQFEFNFWGYGTGEGYKGLSRFTPYVTAGLGFTLALGGGHTSFALNAPVGAGVKYKLKPRVNVGAEWTVRFTTSDKLDVTNTSLQLDSPYGVHSVGLKNKDCYSFLMLFITYDLCPKYRKCNN